MPDGDRVKGGQVDRRLRSKEAEDLPLGGKLGFKDLLVDLEDLETGVDLIVHSSWSVFAI